MSPRHKQEAFPVVVVIISYCSLNLARSMDLKLQLSLVFMVNVEMWRMEHIQSKCNDQGGLPFNWEPVRVCVCVCVWNLFWIGNTCKGLKIKII